MPPNPTCHSDVRSFRQRHSSRCCCLPQQPRPETDPRLDQREASRRGPVTCSADVIRTIGSGSETSGRCSANKQEDEQVFTRSPGPCGSDDSGSRQRAPVALTSIAAKIGCTPQTLHAWIKQAEVDSGQRAGVPSDMAEKKVLERENRELRQANEILRKASAYCAMAEFDRRFKS